MNRLPLLQAEIEKAHSQGFIYKLEVIEGTLVCPKTNNYYFIGHCQKYPQPCTGPSSILYRIELPSGNHGYAVVLVEDLEDTTQLPEHSSNDLSVLPASTPFACSPYDSPKVSFIGVVNPVMERFAISIGAFMGYFDKTLFDGKLPDVLFTYNPKYKGKGFYKPAVLKDEFNSKIGTITLTPGTLLLPRPELCLVMTVLASCHMYHSTCKRATAGYYGIDFFTMLNSIGIDCRNSGGNNRKTGRHLTYHVMQGGPFQRAYEAMPSHLTIPFTPIDLEPISSIKNRKNGIKADTRDPKLKTKYSCLAGCTTVWGRPNQHVICGICGERLLVFSDCGK